MAIGLNFGSGAALASCALERVKVCQLCLIYLWIARSCLAGACSGADSDEAEGEEINNKNVMRKSRYLLALVFLVITIVLLRRLRCLALYWYAFNFLRSSADAGFRLTAAPPPLAKLIFSLVWSFTRKFWI